MGEDVEGPEGGESLDELDALRKEILERHPEEEEPEDAQHIEGKQAESSGSELDRLRDEIARKSPPDESA
jgi:hypothetical protein